MSLDLHDVNGLLKFFQDVTVVPGFTQQQEQGATRPYFYFEPPRSNDAMAASGFFEHRVRIYGVLFLNNQSEYYDVIPVLKDAIAQRMFRIPCADEEFIETNGYLDDVVLSEKIQDTDIVAFEVKATRFVSYPQPEYEPISKINSRRVVK